MLKIKEEAVNQFMLDVAKINVDWLNSDARSVLYNDNFFNAYENYVKDQSWKNKEKVNEIIGTAFSKEGDLNIAYNYMRNVFDYKINNSISADNFILSKKPAEVGMSSESFDNINFNFPLKSKRNEDYKNEFAEIRAMNPNELYDDCLRSIFPDVIMHHLEKNKEVVDSKEFKNRIIQYQSTGSEEDLKSAFELLDFDGAYGLPGDQLNRSMAISNTLEIFNQNGFTNNAKFAALSSLENGGDVSFNNIKEVKELRQEVVNDFIFSTFGTSSELLSEKQREGLVNSDKLPDLIFDTINNHYNQDNLDQIKDHVNGVVKAPSSHAFLENQMSALGKEFVSNKEASVEQIISSYKTNDIPLFTQKEVKLLNNKYIEGAIINYQKTPSATNLTIVQEVMALSLDNEMLKLDRMSRIPGLEYENNVKYSECNLPLHNQNLDKIKQVEFSNQASNDIVVPDIKIGIENMKSIKNHYENIKNENEVKNENKQSLKI